MKKTKKGFSLIETMISISILTVVLASIMNYVVKNRTESKFLSNGNVALKIIKATDRRVEIDGYDFNLWSGLPAATNTEQTLKFAKQAFISRYNTECGVSGGWEPVLDEAKQEKLISCLIENEKTSHYDYQVKYNKNNEDSLMRLDVIMRLKTNFSLKEDGFMELHKKMLNKLKADQPVLKFGNFDAKFSNFNNLAKDLTVTQCLALENDCVIKATWSSDGYGESLRQDGSNNMIKDTISFSKTYFEDNLRCLLWEYDDAGNYQLNNSVDCGIGVYEKTLKPVMATIDASVKDISFFEPIILKETCIKYERDIDGYIVENGTTECGLFTGKDGSQKVIQVVEKMESDAAYSRNTNSMKVDNLITKDINTSVATIKNNLLVEESGSESNLNILVVKDGAEVILNGVTTMNILNNLSKTEFDSNVTISDNTTLPAAPLEVEGFVNLNNLGINTVSLNATVDNKTETGRTRLVPDATIWDGKGCAYTDEGKVVFDGKDVLTCRKTLTTGIYKWSSNRFGQVSQFNGPCPTGWTPFTEANGRTLMGSGYTFDPVAGAVEYQVGKIGGQATVRLSPNQMPAHTHEMKDAYFSEHWGWETSPNGWKRGAGDNGGQDNDNNRYTKRRTTEGQGGNKSHENMMAFVGTTTCIYQEGDKAHESFQYPSSNPDDYWFPYEPLIGEWIQKGFGYDCTADTYTDLRPDGLEYWTRECKQDYQRSVKEREINYLTGATRETGVITFEDKTEKNVEAWVRGTPIFQDWYDISNPYDCTAPQVSTTKITNGYSLTLSCKVMREQLYQERLMMVDSNGNPLQYRNYGLPKKQQQEFQDNYVFLVNNADVYKVCAEWQITAVENIKPWSPDASNYDRTVMVNQSRTVQKYRICTHKTNLEGHVYNVDKSTEYKNEKQNRTIPGSKINLKTWLTYDSNGKWEKASDGSYVRQIINGNPTIFESPTKDYGKDEGSVFKGWIKVGNDNDDDYIGFVMGKQDQKNFYLWSWKKGNQSPGKKGHTFAKVTGGVGVIGWDTHVTKTGYKVLATDLKNGWIKGKTYEFRIEYTRTRVKIFIDGKLLFDEKGTFPMGGVGFYNNSQGQVYYYKPTEEPYYE